MKTWARFDFEGGTTGTVAEVFHHPDDPRDLFPSEWRWIDAPDDARQGSTFDGKTWTHPEDATPAEPAPDPKPARRTLLTPPEFKMQFTAMERVGLRQFRARTEDVDAAIATAAMIVDDWWDIIDDPRLQFVNLALPSTQDGVRGLVPLGLLSAERADEILAGIAE